LNIPCFLGGMARGLLGRNSEIQMRHCRKDALKEADVVILAGMLVFILAEILIKKIKLLQGLFVIFVWVMVKFYQENQKLLL
jgi:hypothetical protein